MADEIKRPLTFRIDPNDLQKLKEIAEKKGLGYQSLLSSVLHQYVNGLLVDADEIKKVVELK